MAVKIRLYRMGAKKRPMYRVVVADSRSPRNGKFIEIIGHYNPISEPSQLSIDEEKALTWLKRGAQPTDTVKKLLERAGIIGKSAERDETDAVVAEEEQEVSEAQEV